MAKITIKEAKTQAKQKALDSLAKYKFQMFGYHAALWTTLNRLDDNLEPNPFSSLVTLARILKEPSLV